MYISLNCEKTAEAFLPIKSNWFHIGFFVIILVFETIVTRPWL